MAKKDKKKKNTKEIAVGEHTLEVTTKGSEYAVAIDGQEYKTFKLSSTSTWFGIEEDFPIEIEGHTYTLALRKRDMRVASNGFYLDNNQEFKEARMMPKWIWVFFVLNILIPIISIGGIINFLIACFGMLLCSLSAKSNLNTVVKILLCLLSTIVAWVIWVIFALFVGVIYY